MSGQASIEGESIYTLAGVADYETIRNTDPGRVFFRRPKSASPPVSEDRQRACFVGVLLRSGGVFLVAAGSA